MTTELTQKLIDPYDNPFKCRKCDREFTNPGNLKHHFFCMSQREAAHYQKIADLRERAERSPKCLSGCLNAFISCFYEGD